jgi:hypothetical protein
VNSPSLKPTRNPDAKIPHNHPSTINAPGVREILRTIARCPHVERVTVGRARFVARGSQPRLHDAGMRMPNGHKYVLRANLLIIDIFVQPVTGCIDQMEREIAALPLYRHTGKRGRS